MCHFRPMKRWRPCRDYNLFGAIRTYGLFTSAQSFQAFRGSLTSRWKMQSSNANVQVAKNKMAKTTKIYFNQFDGYFGLQHKPSPEAERKIV